MNRRCLRSAFVVVIVAIVAGAAVQPARALSGAIFTTDKNGHMVNGNIYRNKCDVYLDGGPGPKAPPSSAALPRGWYFFQVTDPSGKVLLSTDDIVDRQFRVNEYGVIAEASTHPTNEDKDGKQYGAVVVQLCPYDDTPNNGGVYKVWVTRQKDYDWDGSGRHGFIPAFCKTDNFKVGKRLPEQYIHVKKFKGCNANGLWDEGEKELDEWYLKITPPDGPEWPVGDDFQTPYTIVAWPGKWTIREMVKDGWIPTGVLVDEIPQDLQDPPTAVVTLGTKDEVHTVAFGNIPTGCVTACKFYDRNLNLQWDNRRPDLEPGVQGVKVILTGSNVLGPIAKQIGYTGPSGCVSFCDLLPGTYTVTEVVPTNCAWVPTTDTSATVELACEDDASATVEFGNIITGTANFDTKGYWHNKNGLVEITRADITHVNGLAPYSGPSAYFGAGDEPFDGFFTGGTLEVEAAYNKDDDSLIWGKGTPQAEISHFLVDNNAHAELHGHREQLAQQLLAFIFNVRHRLGGDAMIYVPGGDWMSTSDIIDAAIAAWQSGSVAERDAIQTLLDALNNNDAVEYVLDDPGACAPIPPY